MKASMQAIGAFALAWGCATMAVAADEAQKRTSEYERQQNTPVPRSGTHESRQAERKVKQAQMKEQVRKGDVPQAGDDWGMNHPQKVEGTHASRAAERKEKRGEMKALVKSGDMPVTNEAAVNAVKSSP